MGNINRRKRRKKKKMETSKKLLWISYIIAITLTLIVILCSLLNIECSSIASIIPYSYTEVGAVNVFYLNMNKRLNATIIARTRKREQGIANRRDEIHYCVQIHTHPQNFAFLTFDQNTCQYRNDTAKNCINCREPARHHKRWSIRCG